MPWDQQLIATEEDLDVDDFPEDACRGIPLSALFARFGRIIRLRPDSLPIEEQAVLHQNSHTVSDVRFFISHCWGSSGLEKYCALLVHFLGGWAVLCGSLAALLFSVIPFNVEIHTFVVGMPSTELGNPMLHSIFYAGIAVAWAMLLFGGALFKSNGGFLDCACIHQTDPQQKAEGIKLLPAYVKHCNEFVVLWDDKYFTRMWCVYELGTVVATNPQVQLSVLPLRMTVSLIKVNLITTFMASGFFCVWPLMPGLFGILAASFVACVPGFLFVASEARHCSRQCDRLRSLFRDFDAGDAECAVSCDKAMLMANLGEMWAGRGGIAGFNRFVRTEIKDAVLEKAVNQRATISYRSALIATSPTIPFFASIYHSQLSVFTREATVCYAAFVVTFVLAVFPGVMALVATVASRLEDTPMFTWRMVGLSGAEDESISLGLIALCGTGGALVMTLAVASGYVIPIGIALGSLPGWGVARWLGIVAAFAVDTCFVLAALWLFLGGSKPNQSESAATSSRAPESSWAPTSSYAPGESSAVDSSYSSTS